MDMEWTEPKTYIDDSDGLRHCKICKELRQTKVRSPFSNEIQIQGIACRCITKHYDDIRKKNDYNILKRHAFSKSCQKAQDWTFEADDHDNRTVMNIAKNYAKNFEEIRKKGGGLIIYGAVGVGKSFCAACIINELLQDGYKCLMTDFFTIINEYTKTPIDQKNEYIDQITDYDLLVIDDLGVQNTNSYSYSISTAVINARIMKRRPIITTTNFTLTQLLTNQDVNWQRMLSRIVEVCAIIEYVGEDRRQKKSIAGNSDYLQLLGLK